MPSPFPGILLEVPARVRLPAVDHERLSYLEIRDRQDRELVTVVELLSPYGGVPRPRLGDEDTDWARQFLPELPS